MACCHDHDHGDAAYAVPVVLCLTNKNRTRRFSPPRLLGAMTVA